MYVIGIDLETTGLDIQNDKMIELGAVVWDTKQNKPVAMLNHLISHQGLQLPDRIVDITGITDSDLIDFGVEEEEALKDFLKLANKCAYAVAHNGTRFDKPVLDRVLQSYGHSLDIPWIDSVTDVPYPQGISRKLTYLAAEHQFLNPFSHRAQFDVLTMLKVVSEYDWGDIIRMAESPLCRVIAKVTKEERFKAKDIGFRWDSENFKWYKDMKECLIDESQYDFDIDILVLGA